MQLSKTADRSITKAASATSSGDEVEISSTDDLYPMCAGRRGKRTCINTKLISTTFYAKNAAFSICTTGRMQCVLRWNTCLENCNLKNEVCTDKNQRCSEPRLVPERHRLATVNHTAKVFKLFVIAATQVTSRRPAQNAHRTIIDDSNDKPEWLCCGAMHFTCFLAQLLRDSCLYLFWLAPRLLCLVHLLLTSL